MKLHEAADVADRGWVRKFVQEPPDHKDVAAPDDLSVVLGFTQMLSGGGNVDEVSRLATDHGWLDACSRAPATKWNANDISCLVSLCPPASVGHPPHLCEMERSPWSLPKEGRTEQ